MGQSVDRPYIQLLTAELRQLLEDNIDDPNVLHRIFVELLFRERRPARELRAMVAERLAALSESYFKWPTTEASQGIDHLDDTQFQYQQGLLGFVGYRVGAYGVAASQRQELLGAIYEGPLPSVNSRAYMDEWGAPRTATRLRKLSYAIATFARNAKRRDRVHLATAITQWEEDLDYLKRTYYVGQYDFPWPTTVK